MQDKALSHRAYNKVIGAGLLWGLIVSAILAKAMMPTVTKWSWWVIIIVYLVLAIAGITISTMSDVPIISFIGYNLVIVPTSIILSVATYKVAPSIIVNALWITALVVGVMILLSNYWLEEIFLSMERMLGATLIAVILAEILLMLILPGRLKIWDALVAGVFALYVGYDWAKAQECELTLDNAIDACVSLYIDIVQIFLRVLEIFRS